jgi:hypothetical protein
MFWKVLSKLALVLLGILLVLTFQFIYGLLTEKYTVFVADARVGPNHPVSGITVKLGTANCGDFPCHGMEFSGMEAKTNKRGVAVFPAYRFPLFFSPKTGGYMASIPEMPGEFVDYTSEARSSSYNKVLIYFGNVRVKNINEAVKIVKADDRIKTWANRGLLIECGSNKFIESSWEVELIISSDGSCKLHEGKFVRAIVRAYTGEIESIHFITREQIYKKQY